MKDSFSFNIWRCKGFFKAKIKYLLSFLLIYPFWRKKKHIQDINENINLLDKFRSSILEIVKIRQNKVKEFWDKNRIELKQNLIPLCETIINQEINYENMVKIELEIENFRDIVLLAHNMRDAFRELETELLSNEMDVNNLIRGYICFYTNFVFFNRRYPWNQLLICIDIKKYEINKQSEQA